MVPKDTISEIDEDVEDKTEESKLFSLESILLRYFT